MFAGGNELYARKEFTAALAAYQAVDQMGHGSAALYYNIGNCHFRMKNIGLAILNYERAWRLNPYDEDIEFNLEYARLFVQDQIVPVPGIFLIEYPVRFVKWLPFHVVILSATALWYLFIAMWSATRTHPEFSERVRWTRWRGYLIGAMVLLVFVFAVKMYMQGSTKTAVIIRPIVDVKNEPDGDSATGFQLHDGTKADWVERSESWMKIRLADGKVGWVMDRDVGLIE